MQQQEVLTSRFVESLLEEVRTRRADANEPTASVDPLLRREVVCDMFSRYREGAMRLETYAIAVCMFDDALQSPPQNYPTATEDQIADICIVGKACLAAATLLNETFMYTHKDLHPNVRTTRVSSTYIDIMVRRLIGLYSTQPKSAAAAMLPINFMRRTTLVDFVALMTPILIQEMATASPHYNQSLRRARQTLPSDWGTNGAARCTELIVLVMTSEARLCKRFVASTLALIVLALVHGMALAHAHKLSGTMSMPLVAQMTLNWFCHAKSAMCNACNRLRIGYSSSVRAAEDSLTPSPMDNIIAAPQIADSPTSYAPKQGRELRHNGKVLVRASKYMLSALSTAQERSYTGTFGIAIRSLIKDYADTNCAQMLLQLTAAIAAYREGSVEG